MLARYPAEDPLRVEVMTAGRCRPAPPLVPPRRRPEATALVERMQHGELRPGEVQELLQKAKADLAAADAAKAAGRPSA